MRYLVLATDYDGTLAHHGQLDTETVAALDRLRASGRRLILVTGRELDDLMRVCPFLDRFDRIVAENGALLYRPADKSEQLLGEPPPPAFIDALKERGVAPLSIGRCIVATWQPHEVATLEVIRELGLELQVIFNKGAVMVLPAGVNKASGLRAALGELGFSPHNVVAVGDAENDHAFLSLCECGVAVANSLPLLKERADWVTRAGHGAGVVELIDTLLDDDMARYEISLQRHMFVLGSDDRGREQRISPYGANLLLSGSSGSGKSTLATALLDQMVAHGYQFCIIDPEGDYDSYENAAVLGDQSHEPTVEAVLSLLAKPEQNVVVNLLGVSLGRRPAFLDELLPRLQELRGQTGRPHWIVVDEAHHMLHAARTASTLPLPRHPSGMLYITVHPSQMAPSVLATIDNVVIVGDAPDATLRSFAQLIGLDLSRLQAWQNGLGLGELLYWKRSSPDDLARLSAVRPTSEHQRHIRKYAVGDMKYDSFYFRGVNGTLNLRAQNLMIFMQIADGIDDATWMYHLHRGDYTSWFRHAVKDESLAAEAAQIAGERSLDPRASRERIRAAVERRYTAPA